MLVEVSRVFERLQVPKPSKLGACLEPDCLQVTGLLRSLEQALDGAHASRVAPAQAPLPRPHEMTPVPGGAGDARGRRPAGGWPTPLIGSNR